MLLDLILVGKDLEFINPRSPSCVCSELHLASPEMKVSYSLPSSFKVKYLVTCLRLVFMSLLGILKCEDVFAM